MQLPHSYIESSNMAKNSRNGIWANARMLAKGKKGKLPVSPY
jgi:hypothetical protein